MPRRSKIGRPMAAPAHSSQLFPLVSNVGVCSPQDGGAAEIAARFAAGDYATVALEGANDDWRTFAARGLLGLTREALDGLDSLKGIKTAGLRTEGGTPQSEEPTFYRAVAHWIGGEEEAAIRLLTPLELPHARRLLALLRKPTLSLLTRLPASGEPPWGLLAGIEADPKFQVRPLEFDADAFSCPDSGEARFDLLRGFDPNDPPDLFVCLMAEWQMLPPNLRDLPCPLFVATTDFDMHLQNLYPWLRCFDGLITESASQHRALSLLFDTPITAYPKLSGLPPAPEQSPIPSGPRVWDLFFSGTVLHPFHPDKARLLHQALAMPEVRVHILNGFQEAPAYQAALARARLVYSYVRFPGAITTRALEALSQGCAVLVQRGCPLALFAGEQEGVFAYDAGDDDGTGCDLPHAVRRALDLGPELTARARHGADIVRHEFALPRLGAQFARLLTFLAARPRPPHLPSPTLRLISKAKDLWQGWPPLDLAARDRMLAHNTARFRKEMQSAEMETARTACIDLTRELALDHAARCTLEPADSPAQQARLDTALNAFREGLPRFPASLALRFNFIRTMLHYGDPVACEEALCLARETLAQPETAWRLDPQDDVFPWNYHPESFHSRAYFALTLRDLQAKPRPDSGQNDSLLVERIRLILASLSSAVGRHSEPELPWLERAAALDPKFPFYSFSFAKALLRRDLPGDTQQAGEILTGLAEGTVLTGEATDLLTALREQGRFMAPGWERLALARDNARRRTSQGQHRWCAQDEKRKEQECRDGRQEGETEAHQATLARLMASARPLPLSLLSLAGLCHAGADEAPLIARALSSIVPTHLRLFHLGKAVPDLTSEDLKFLAALEGRVEERESDLIQNPKSKVCCLPPPAFPSDFLLESPTDIPARRTARLDFDGDALPPDWHAACASLDALWLPTAFHRDACVAAGLDAARLWIIPSPLLTERYDPTLPPLPLPGRHGFTFLAVGDLSLRNGLDLLVTAFVQEFSAQESVCLVLKLTSPTPLSPERCTRTITDWVQRALLHGAAQMPTLVLHTEALSAENRPNLLCAADVFVTAQRGSRANRWLLEAMALGLPTIGPAWGGAGEALGGGRGIAVTARRTPVPPKGERECGSLVGGHWAEMEIQGLRSALREAFAARERGWARAATAQTWVRSHHDWHNVAERMRASLGQEPLQNVTLDLIL